MPEPSATSWHLDKRVPISLILAIAIQTVTIVWWASSMESRVTQNTDRLTRTATEVAEVRAKLTVADVQNARLDQRLIAVTESLTRIEKKLDRLDGQPTQPMRANP